MAQTRRRQTRSTGVSLEISVLEYLQHVCEALERDRSFCINKIIREHAQREGHPIVGDQKPEEPQRQES